MLVSEWIKDVQNAKKRKAMPLVSFPGIQLLDLTIADILHNAEKQFLVMQAIANRYDMLASVGPMDLSLEAEALGAEISFYEDAVPSVSKALINDEKDLAKIKDRRFEATGRIGETIKATTLAVQSITNRPVFPGVIGPFSLAGRLLDMTQIVYKAVDEPEFVEAVLHLVTDFLIQYIEAFKATGAHGIIMAEPAAGLLAPDWNRQFSIPFVTKIIETVASDSFMVIYHNCGNVVPLIDDIIQTGAQGFHFGNAINLTDIADKIPADRLFFGNIDPVEQFSNGTPLSIYQSATELLAKMQAYPQFVLSSGCDVPHQTPLATLDAFFKAQADFS